MWKLFFKESTKKPSIYYQNPWHCSNINTLNFELIYDFEGGGIKAVCDTSSGGWYTGNKSFSFFFTFNSFMMWSRDEESVCDILSSDDQWWQTNKNIIHV